MCEFLEKLCGKFEHIMSQGCWFVFVSIGIVVVFDVTILAKYTIFGNVGCCWTLDCRLLNIFGEDFVDGDGWWYISTKDIFMSSFSGKIFSVWNKWCLTMLHNVDWKLYTFSYTMICFSGKMFSVEINDV